MLFVRHIFNAVITHSYEVMSFEEVEEADRAAIAMLDAAGEEGGKMPPVVRADIDGVGMKKAGLINYNEEAVFYYLTK